MLEELCRNPEVRALDFGFGDAQYTSAFAEESWKESNVIVFVPTVQAVSVKLAHSLGPAALVR